MSSIHPVSDKRASRKLISGSDVSWKLGGIKRDEAEVDPVSLVAYLLLCLLRSYRYCIAIRAAIATLGGFDPVGILLATTYNCFVRVAGRIRR